MSKVITPDLFNLEDPEIQKDPYPYYPVLREQKPVLRSNVGGQPCWILSRRKEISKVLMDPHTYSNRHTPLPNMLFTDPPEHERLRLMVSSMFTRAAVQPMAAQIQAHAELLIERQLDVGHCDIIEDFAGPLSIETIGRLLGIAGLHVEKLRQLSHLFVSYVRSLQLALTPSSESRLATEELTQLMTDLVQSHSYEDGRVISVLADLRRTGELTTDGFVNFAILLLVAGHSTTTNLMGNAVYMLTKRPQDFNRMAEDESFVAPFLDEVLRTRPSFHRIHRVTTRDVELDGEFIPAGSIVRLMLASANRDPDFFDDAETFDPDEKRRNHLSFGQGIHTCLGSWLARLEASTAVAVLSRLVASVTLDQSNPPVPYSGGSFNEFGFERLPVILSPRK